MEQVAIDIANLSYQYRTDWAQRKVTAVSNVSLQIQKGEAFGFLGHNGAGKTTTIKCILGLVHPSSGSVKIFGRDGSDVKSRIGLGYVPEQPYFYDHLSVWETMSLYARLKEIPSSKIEAQVSSCLARLGLSSRHNSPMRSLSKGLMQRVAMAQAILGDSQLLVLDEPFSGLDPVGRKEFRELILELKGEGRTIFMSSHILSDVENVCDRASILVQGELKAIFDLHQLREESEEGIEVTLRTGGVNKELLERLTSGAHTSLTRGELLELKFSSRKSAEGVLRVALENDITVESFLPVHKSLEEIFVQIVNESKSSAGAKS